MEVVRCATPEEFLVATEIYRRADPARTSILSTVPATVASGVRTYETCWWWVVLDEDAVCVGASFRTAPFGLQIGPMSREAAQLLAIAIALQDAEFPWVVGPEEAVTAFLDEYSRGEAQGSRRRFERGLHSLIYELGDLRAPRVEGSYRAATLDDLDLVVQWMHDFEAFTGVNHPAIPREREFVISRIEEDSMRLWSVHDRPVAMAGHAPTVETPAGLLSRIGPVFTPEELRGHGYGSAVTAALSEELIARGSRVVLYADADYPVSNHVYQKLGFRPIDDVIQFDQIDAR